MADLPKLTYTVQEAIRLTNLSRCTLWRAVVRGKLKKCRTGTRRLLFTLQALQEFLDGTGESTRSNGQHFKRSGRDTL